MTSWFNVIIIKDYDDKFYKRFQKNIPIHPIGYQGMNLGISINAQRCPKVWTLASFLMHKERHEGLESVNKNESCKAWVYMLAKTYWNAKKEGWGAENLSNNKTMCTIYLIPLLEYDNEHDQHIEHREDLVWTTQD
jgi:hypothetical protein